ncbi:MAG: RNA polymerase sigma factor [Bacteroidota bacterium]
MPLDQHLNTLLNRCLKHDRRAQRELYDNHYSWALNICIRYARSKAEAEEVVNDGFIKVFRGLASFDREQALRPWLRRIFVNAALDQLKKKSWDPQPIDMANEIMVLPKSIDYLQYEDVLAAIQSLSPAYRAVFNLHEVEGYKHTEIASLLSISESTSRSNLLRAKRLLRKQLQHLDHPLSRPA